MEEHLDKKVKELMDKQNNLRTSILYKIISSVFLDKTDILDKINDNYENNFKILRLLFFDSHTSYSKNIDLPYSITSITFGCFFNQPKIIKNFDITPRDEQLHIYSKLNCLSDSESLSHNIKKIQVNNCRDIMNLRELKIDYLKTLNINITHIIYGENFNLPLEKGDIPYGITHIIIGKEFNESIDKDAIPNSVIHLEIGDNFNQIIKKGDIPNSVQNLIIGNRFNKPLDKEVIPNSVINFKIGNNFNQILKKGDIPNSVKYLTIGNGFNQTLDKGVIPNSVIYVRIGHSFNQPLEKGSIPNNVIHLILGNFFDQILNDDNIPENTFHIIVSNKNKCFFSSNNKLIGVYVYHSSPSSSVHYDDFEKVNIEKIIDDYIMKRITEVNLIGEIISRELIEKVLDPNRLLSICNQYNMTLQELIKIYR